MTQPNDQVFTTITATRFDHENLHNDISKIISRKLQSGIGNTTKEWQDFLCSPLRSYVEFNQKSVDQSARLIEVITLDVITNYVNDINKGRLRYVPAFLPQQSDSNLLPFLGKDSCDGLMIEVDRKKPEIVLIEQKSSMRNPSDSDIGDINDYFRDWINNLLNEVRGDRLFWVFNVMPYSDETVESRTPFDIKNAIELIHSKKEDIFAGAVCFYTHPDESTIEVICAPIRQAARSDQINEDELKKMRYTK